MRTLLKEQVSRFLLWAYRLINGEPITDIVLKHETLDFRKVIDEAILTNKEVVSATLDVKAITERQMEIRLLDHMRNYIVTTYTSIDGEVYLKNGKVKIEKTIYVAKPKL